MVFFDGGGGRCPGANVRRRTTHAAVSAGSAPEPRAADAAAAGPAVIPRWRTDGRRCGHRSGARRYTSPQIGFARRRAPAALARSVARRRRSIYNARPAGRRAAGKRPCRRPAGSVRRVFHGGRSKAGGRLGGPRL